MWIHCTTALDLKTYSRSYTFSVKAEVSETTQRLPVFLKSTDFLCHMSRFASSWVKKSFKPLNAATKLPPTIVNLNNTTTSIQKSAGNARLW